MYDQLTKARIRISSFHWKSEQDQAATSDLRQIINDVKPTNQCDFTN